MNDMKQQRTVVEDPRLGDLVDPAEPVERLGGGSTWAEGPVWLPDEDALIWSDIPGNRLLRWSAATGEVRVDRAEVEFHNGHTLDLQGRMLACSHGRRAIERIEADGSVTVLVNRYGQARFNAPNDLVVKSDGSIWFTDPSYGIVKLEEGHPGYREYGDHYVFRFVEAIGELTPVVLDMVDPNGLAFSPDERILYVSDTSAGRLGDGKHWIRAYDVVDGRLCKNGRVFAEVSPGVPDGFRVDIHGNIWTSSGDSVQVYAPDGTRLGRVPVPEKIGNLCFGGPDRDVLYIAATSSLYRLRTRIRGASPLDLRP